MEFYSPDRRLSRPLGGNAGARSGGAQAGRTEAVFHSRVRDRQAIGLVGTPAVAAKPAVERGAAMRAGKLSKGGLHRVTMHRQDAQFKALSITAPFGPITV